MRNFITKPRGFLTRPSPNESFFVRFLRGIGLAAILAGVIFLFWQNNEQAMNRLSFKEIVVDLTNTLSSDQKKSVIDLSQAMEKRFGVNLVIRITQSDLGTIKADPRRIIIALCPVKRQSLVILPPLVRSGLAKDFVFYLEEQHFQKAWESTPWPQSLSMALGLLWENMRRLEVRHG